MLNRRQSVLGLTAVVGNLFLGAGVGTDIGNPLRADPPSLLSMFKAKDKQVAADPFQLHVENGPWLILAYTFPGEDARPKAEALAKELQKSLKRPCYVLEKSFDHNELLKTDRYETRRLDGTIESRRVRLANRSKESVHAVLVGDFASLEDPSIESTLEAIRTAHPTSIPSTAPAVKDPAKGESTDQLVESARRNWWSQSKRESNQKKGPMGAAFVTRNPLLPEEFFQAAKVDDFVVSLNKNVEHSLLKCPGDFSVRVASFHGKAATDFGNGSRASKMDKVTNVLDEAAEKANRMTTALRAKGVEAYEFHDRYASFVTIGSFTLKELGGQQPNGEFQYSPDITRILNEYTGYQMIDAKVRSTQAMTKIQSGKLIDGIPLDIEGKAMAVPRPATSKIYSGSLLGRKLMNMK